MIAALRVLFARSAAELGGRTVEQLCDPALPTAPNFAVEQAVYRTSMGICAMVRWAWVHLLLRSVRLPVAAHARKYPASRG